MYSTFICKSWLIISYLTVLSLMYLASYNSTSIIGEAVEKLKVVKGPKYDGEYLHKIVREKLGDIRLNETLTNVVIPTFDIKRLQPVIFSSYEVCIFVSLGYIF